MLRPPSESGERVRRPTESLDPSSQDEDRRVHRREAGATGGGGRLGVQPKPSTHLPRTRNAGSHASASNRNPQPTFRGRGTPAAKLPPALCGRRLARGTEELIEAIVRRGLREEALPDGRGHARHGNGVEIPPAREDSDPFIEMTEVEEKAEKIAGHSTSASADVLRGRGQMFAWALNLGGNYFKGR